jgi:proteasome assembly chaperone (PAC2) family protein
VAAKDGSDKAIQARKIAGCVLVKASWLVDCYVSMLRCDVKQHLMGSKAEMESMMQRVAQHDDMLKQLQEDQQTLNKSKVDNTTSGGDRTDSDDDEDDDDLAAEFEKELMNL